MLEFVRSNRKTTTCRSTTDDYGTILLDPLAHYCDETTTNEYPATSRGYVGYVHIDQKLLNRLHGPMHCKKVLRVSIHTC